MNLRTIDTLNVGDAASFSKTISESDVYLFAGITGDFNPAHMDEVYASQTPFKGRIAHGILAAGLISGVLGTRLPGPGAIYLNQTLSFRAPVRIGDTITARAEITALNVEKNRVTLRTWCENQDGTVVVEGEALLLAPKAPKTS